MQALTASSCSFFRGVRLQAPPRRQQIAVSTRVVAEKAETRASDFRQMTNEEIDAEVKLAKTSLFLDFRIKQRLPQVSLSEFELHYSAEQKLNSGLAL